MTKNTSARPRAPRGAWDAAVIARAVAGTRTEDVRPDEAMAAMRLWATTTPVHLS